MEEKEELHNRKPNEIETTADEIACQDELKDEVELPDNYDIENDPDYKYIFVIFKLLITVLAYVCFHLCFNTFIRPLFISLDERIAMVISALQEQWCHDGVCTDEDQRTIQAIVKNIKESGRRFW